MSSNHLSVPVRPSWVHWASLGFALGGVSRSGGLGIPGILTITSNLCLNMSMLNLMLKVD